MLPKIPYAMHKNKKLSIPFGNFNRSSSFGDGDIYESHNISARKYPYLTTKKANRKLSDYDGRDVEAITVFDGKLVTSQADGVYIDQKKVFDVEDTYGTRFAPINTKLVIYPDKKGIEKTNGEFSTFSLEAKVTTQTATFESNYIIAEGALWELPVLYFDGDDNSLVTDFSRVTTIPEETYNFSDGVIAHISTEAFGKSEFTTPKEGSMSFEMGGREDEKEKFSSLQGRHFKLQKDSGTAFGYIDEVEYDGGESFRWTIHCTNVDVFGPATSGVYTLYVESSDGIVTFDRFFRKSDILAIEDYAEGTTDYEYIKVGKVTEVTASSFKLSGDPASPTSQISVRVSKNYPYGHYPRLDGVVEGTQIVLNSQTNTVYTVTNVKENKIYLKEDINTAEYFKQTATVSSSDLFECFKVGDAVEISGCSFGEDNSGVDKGEDNNITFVISRIQKGVLFASTDIFTPGKSKSGVTIERRVPDLDFICEKDNRLYGVSNKDKTIYVSALGDPTNMFAYEGVSTDSFAVAVGGEGDFTACCKYGDSVLFFKEDKLYKLTGSYPAEFALYSYDVEGVTRDSEKSCVVLNEVLYYHGDKGIYAYSGGVPTLISSNFGEFRGHNAVGCTDGENYYVALRNSDADDDTYLFSYNTRLNLWTLEERQLFYVDAARVQGKPMFLTKDGEIYELNWNEDVRNQKWSVQFTPFYETIEGKKSYSRIVMRVSIPMDSYMQIRLRFNGGYWLNAGTVVGKGEGIIPVRIPINRCDKFELELSGKGECTILDIMREYYVSEE